MLSQRHFLIKQFSGIYLILLISSNRSLGLDNILSSTASTSTLATQSKQPTKQLNAISQVDNLNSAITNTANSIKPLLQVALAAAPNVVSSAQHNNLQLSAQSHSSGSTTVKAQPTQPQQQQSPQSQPPPPLPSQQAAAVTVEQPQLTQISYGNEDPIQYLDYSSINDEILRKRTANFIYFNADFNHCRNCNKFFNIWKDLAVDIRWWKQVIKLFAINCSDEDNIEMCRRAGVTQFPQVKYYWIMSNSLDNDGQRLHILGRSLHAMRHLIMDRVLESYVEHNKLLVQQQQQQQQSQRSLGSNTGLVTAATTTTQSTTATNPLSALMSNPLIGQMLSSITSSNGALASGGGLSSIVSALTGGGKIGGATSSIPLLGNLLGGVGTTGGQTQSLNQIMSAVMQSATGASNRALLQPLPNNWPELELIEVNDIQQFVGTLPLDTSRNIGALLIMETQEFLYSGLEVMLDLSPYGNQSYIARVRDDRSLLSKNLTKRDDIRAPALIYVSPLQEAKLIMTAPKYTNDEDLRRAFVRAFERKQIKYPVKRIWSSAQQLNSVNNQQLSIKYGSGFQDNQEEEELLAKINNVYISDLTNAVRASLMEQVFRHPELSDDQYNALVKYVYALINYFPFNNEDGVKFIKRLHSWLQNQVSPMDVSEYKKQFHDIDEALPQRKWIACKSLSNTKTIPSKSRKSASLFENPAQLGKVVSNITRLFRGQQQQVGKLKNLLNVFTSSSNSNPVMLNQQQKQQQQQPTHISGGSNSSISSSSHKNDETKTDDSPMERIIKSFSSGSLGSDTSILRLISNTLTGAANSPGANGKSKFAREYSCGAWKLAHVMVVNEYIRDSPRKDVKHIVLHSLYQYMLHFYACPTCGNRVSDVRGEFRLNLDDSLQDQGDSVLLLWKVHNRVNKRLENEFRPGSPTKLQFPTESMCPKCRGPRAQNDLLSTPNWHEKQVLNFIVHHYRPQSLLFNSNSTDSSSSSSSATMTIHDMKSVLQLIYINLISLFFINGLIINNCFKLHF